MTPQVVRDLAECIAGRLLEECWTQHFVQHYSDELKSVFLKPIDKQHKWAESVVYIKAFYQLVTLSIVLFMNNILNFV